MQILPIKTQLLEKDFNFEKALEESLNFANLKLQEKDVLIIASKIVALSQGRLLDLKADSGETQNDIEKNFRKLVEKEAEFISPVNDWLTLKDGIFIANAGIDRSNVPDGFCVLWPEDSYKFADNLCRNLKKKFNLKELGIVICDSHCTALRRGVTGVSLGYAGFEGVEDLRGDLDLYGKELKVTTRNLADSVCSAALLVMGESNESTPLALIRDLNAKFTDLQIDPNDVKISMEEDLFKGVLKINQY